MDRRLPNTNPQGRSDGQTPPIQHDATSPPDIFDSTHDDLGYSDGNIDASLFGAQYEGSFGGPLNVPLWVRDSEGGDGVFHGGEVGGDAFDPHPPPPIFGMTPRLPLENRYYHPEDAVGQQHPYPIVDASRREHAAMSFHPQHQPYYAATPQYGGTPWIDAHSMGDDLQPYQHTATAPTAQRRRHHKSSTTNRSSVRPPISGGATKSSSSSTLDITADDHAGEQEDEEVEEEEGVTETRPPTPLSRIRNRQATRRSREKSRRMELETAARGQELAAQNETLASQVEGLREEVLGLRAEILRHGNCDSPLIQEYIARSASEVSSDMSRTPFSHTWQRQRHRQRQPSPGDDDMQQ